MTRPFRRWLRRDDPYRRQVLDAFAELKPLPEADRMRTRRAVPEADRVVVERGNERLRFLRRRA